MSRRGWPLVVFLGYLVLIVAPLGLLIWRGAPTQKVYEATRELAPGHRIVAGDVRTAWIPARILVPSWSTIKGFEGRYVVSRVARAGALTFAPDSTADYLRLTTVANMALVWIPLADSAPTDPRTIDPGQRVDVCGLSDDGTQCLDSVEVATVACDDRVPSLCSVGVWVTRDRRAFVLKALDTALTTPPKRRLRVMTHS
jgi:hypothetical protein